MATTMKLHGNPLLLLLHFNEKKTVNIVTKGVEYMEYVKFTKSLKSCERYFQSVTSFVCESKVLKYPYISLNYQIICREQIFHRTLNAITE